MSVKDKNTDIYKKILKRREDFKSFFGREADKIEMVFDDLILQLNEEKNHLLKKISDNQTLTLEEVNSNVRSVSEYLKEIELI